MSQTYFGAASAGRKTAFIAETWSEFTAQFIFSTKGMLSAGLNDSGNVVHNVDKLTDPDGRGTKAVMPFVPDLKQDGTVGANVLVNRFEAMDAQFLSIQIDQIRHGTQRASAIKEQETTVRFRVQARQKLAKWLAAMHNEIGILTLCGISYGYKLKGEARSPNSQLASLSFAGDVSAPTSERQFFCGDGTAKNNMSDSDTMAWNRIIEVAAFAETEMLPQLSRGGSNGRFILLLHSNHKRDLKKDPNYKDAMQGAAARGDSNALFTGADEVIDNVAIYSTPWMPSTYNAASGSKWGTSGTVDGAQAMLVGAQALAWANIGSPDWKEDSTIDMGDKPAISIGQTFGWRKPVWKGSTMDTAQDYGAIAIYAATKKLQ